MKRCPQCDFAYEDDQSLCDMDGSALVYATRELPLISEHVAPPAPAPPAPPAKSRPRSYAVLPLAGVILGTALSLAAYVVTHRTAPQDTKHAPASVTAAPQPAPNLVLAPPAAPPTPAPTPAPIANVKAAGNVPPKATKRASAAVKPAPTPAPSPSPRREEKKPKPENAKNKKESKLGSMLKKAGRVLKKPFEF